MLLSVLARLKRIGARDHAPQDRHRRFADRLVLDEIAERRIFFDQVNDRYESLRADPSAWSEVEAERSVEGCALRDSSQASLGDL
jgi:hypothetical protein